MTYRSKTRVFREVTQFPVSFVEPNLPLGSRMTITKKKGMPHFAKIGQGHKLEETL